MLFHVRKNKQKQLVVIGFISTKLHAWVRLTVSLPYLDLGVPTPTLYFKSHYSSGSL